MVGAYQRRLMADPSFFHPRRMPFTPGSPIRVQPLPLTGFPATATEGLQSFDQKQ